MNTEYTELSKKLAWKPSMWTTLISCANNLQVLNYKSSYFAFFFFSFVLIQFTVSCPVLYRDLEDVTFLLGTGKIWFSALSCNLYPLHVHVCVQIENRGNPQELHSFSRRFMTFWLQVLLSGLGDRRIGSSTRQPHWSHIHCSCACIQRRLYWPYIMGIIKPREFLGEYTCAPGGNSPLSLHSQVVVLTLRCCCQASAGRRATKVI